MKPDILIFDLDDTLYQPETGMWEQIGKRIDLFIQERLGAPPGNPLRKDLFQRYGTTMRGLVAEYGIDTQDYLKFVHDVPVAQILAPNPGLKKALEQIPIPKMILTNSDRPHATRVTSALGIYDCFEKIVDINDLNPYCKPQNEAYHKALQLLGNPAPQKCILFEDSAQNIAAAQGLGFVTVQVNHKGQRADSDFRLETIDQLASLFTPDFSVIPRGFQDRRL